MRVLLGSGRLGNQISSYRLLAPLAGYRALCLIRAGNDLDLDVRVIELGRVIEPLAKRVNTKLFGQGLAQREHIGPQAQTITLDPHPPSRPGSWGRYRPR